MKLRTAAAALALTCAFASTQAQTAKHKVLFAVTSGDAADWGLAMANARNLVNGLPKGSTEVEFVAFGPGINLVKKDSTAAATVKTLEDEQHVKFYACQNAMRAYKLTSADLLENTGEVPAGIIEVVTKQEQGWTYIKAGK